MKNKKHTKRTMQLIRKVKRCVLPAGAMADAELGEQPDFRPPCFPTFEIISHEEG